MTLEFLRNNGASRVTDESAQPDFIIEDVPTDVSAEDKLDLGFERQASDWETIDVTQAASGRDWADRPGRFVDGKDVGRTVAWLRSPEGYPSPVRLAQVGAVALRETNGELRREFAMVERVVVMADMFPWDEVESFALALRAENFRLLLHPKPAQGWSYLYEPIRKATVNRSSLEMIDLERLAFSQDRALPTLVDGPLAPRTSIPTDDRSPVIGVVKTHVQNYLHQQGWQVFYDLQPGQRTPAFRIQSQRWGGFSVVSWFLRLDGQGGSMPNWGVVRLEMPEGYFANSVGSSFDYLNRVSRLVYDYRCRDDQYRRAPISLHPIQRAEEMLGALFSQSDSIVNHFYRLTSL